jgi:hypothetical protein
MPANGNKTKELTVNYPGNHEATGFQYYHLFLSAVVFIPKTPGS